MRQLIFERPGSLRWEEVPPPTLVDPEAAVVRPLAIATCDLDTAVLRGRVPSFVGPYPFGHEAIAEVVDVGEDVASVAAGDRVAVPFQIACGACRRCRRGHPSHCERHEGVNAFGLGPIAGSWHGLLADLALVPHADGMLVPVPVAMPPAAASLSDNLPDALRTVLPIETHGGDVLIVAGGGPSIGLYAIGFARALGASSVTYIDTDAVRLDAAERAGATVIDGRPDRLPDRFAVTVDASGRPEGLSLALRSTDVGGTCTSIGIYWDEPRIPFADMFFTGVTFTTGMAEARPLMPRIVEMIEEGSFDPSLPITRYADWDAAADVLADPADKTILVRS